MPVLCRLSYSSGPAESQADNPFDLSPLPLPKSSGSPKGDRANPTCQVVLAH